MVTESFPNMDGTFAIVESNTFLSLLGVFGTFWGSHPIKVNKTANVNRDTTDFFIIVTFKS